MRNLADDYLFGELRVNIKGAVMFPARSYDIITSVAEDKQHSRKAVCLVIYIIYLYAGGIFRRLFMPIPI